MIISSKFEILNEWVDERFFYAAVSKLKNGDSVYIFRFW